MLRASVGQHRPFGLAPVHHISTSGMKRDVAEGEQVTTGKIVVEIEAGSKP
jgi:hypothetical protein